MAFNSKNLSNHNSILRVKYAGIYDDWVTIRGFQADNRTTQDSTQLAETIAGVDGHASHGYTYNLAAFNVYMMPDSPSLAVFRNIARDYKKNGRTQAVQFQQVNTELGRSAEFEGVMTNAPLGSGGGKLFAGEQYTFSIDPVVEEEI